MPGSVSRRRSGPGSIARGMASVLPALVLAVACGPAAPSAIPAGTPPPGATPPTEAAATPPPLAAPGFEASGPLLEARWDHAAVALGDGRVLVLGGAIATDDETNTAELFDPATGTFTAAGSMTERRTAAAATLLDDGRVLVTGGGTKSTMLRSAELYDPVTDRFAAAGDLTLVRLRATATLLADGRVLIAGGYDGGATMLASADVYDPATGGFAPTAAMGVPRYGHTATLLADGRVLVIGGGNASAELYDPASGRWEATGQMFNERAWHVAALLADGRVLVVGGGPNDAELYDPATGAFEPAGGTECPSEGATATLLADGRVLVAGGLAPGGTIATSTWLYDVIAGDWSTAAPLATLRSGPTATLLPDGSVLVAGGGDERGDPLATTERFFAGGLPPGATPVPQPTPANPGNFAQTGSLETGRAWHTATLLEDGRVLVAGGSTGGDLKDLSVRPEILAGAELFDPASGSFSAVGSLVVPRYEHTATLLPDGTVLVVGGRTTAAGDPPLASAERFDPRTGTSAATGSLMMGRARHQAVALADGRVLIVGGGEHVDPSTLREAFGELYDPVDGSFSLAGGLPTSLAVHSATALADGRVLVVGTAMGDMAAGSGPALTSGVVLAATPQQVSVAFLFDPSTGRFARTGTPILPPGEPGHLLAGHAAARLDDGRVLLAGAEGTDVTPQLFDPATGEFTGTGRMIAQRSGHTATLLPDGRVLIAGGDGGSGALDYSELYDPAAGTFSRTGPLLVARAAGHTATRLDDDSILVVGGLDALDGPGFAEAERYR